MIGIDLGTKFSCCAVMTTRLEIIQTEEGKNFMASEVFYSKDGKEMVVGNGARLTGKKDGNNLIYDPKRLIGNHFDDPKVQEDIKNFRFKVVKGEGDEPVFKLKLDSGDALKTPVDVSADILRKMKERAEKVLEEVKGAVITVPAYFGSNQREKTKKAAELAGLNVIDMINEPTAAAIAYGCEEKDKEEEEKVILVYDFGGGTFDVSIIRVNHPDYKVLCVGGDSHLGGEDITNNLVNYFCNLYKEKTGEDLRVTKKNKMRSLYEKCEILKIELSCSKSSEIDFSLFEDEDISRELSVSKFNDINRNIFNKTIETVVETIDGSGLEVKDIDEILLVGGSSRIPAIYDLIKSTFRDIKIKSSVNPEETVARGAALLAHQHLEEQQRGYKVLVNDIVTKSLGIHTPPYSMTKLIMAKTKKPCKVSKVFSNNDDSRIDFYIYEGESEDVRENDLIGNFQVTGFTPSPRGMVKVKVIFEVDEGGILTVTAANPGYSILKTYTKQL